MLYSTGSSAQWSVRGGPGGGRGREGMGVQGKEHAYTCG